MSWPFGHHPHSAERSAGSTRELVGGGCTRADIASRSPSRCRTRRAPARARSEHRTPLRHIARTTQSRISRSSTWWVRPSLQMTNESPGCSGPLVISSSGSSYTPIARVMTLLPAPGLGLLGGDDAVRHKLLHLGVVARQLRRFRRRARRRCGCRRTRRRRNSPRRRAAAASVAPMITAAALAADLLQLAVGAAHAVLAMREQVGRRGRRFDRAAAPRSPSGSRGRPPRGRPCRRLPPRCRPPDGSR